MTEEQILEYFKDINHAYNDCTRYDTLKRMLDELQEPCEDAISRKAVLDLINADWKYEGLEEPINSLPPVNQFKPICCPSMGIDCEDCPAYEDTISRQAVFEQIGGWISSGEYDFTNATDYLCKRIKGISSVSSSEKPNKSEWQHDHEILKAYSDGASVVLDKVRAEIDEQYDRVHPYDISCAEGLEMALNIVDKYIAEEDKA